MDASPTALNRLSVLDGKGPPWCIAGNTDTPVGTPLFIMRPHFKERVGKNALKSSEEPITVPVNCPDNFSKQANSSR